MKRMLVVYYSQAFGNTKKIAETLARRTGSDIERIVPVVPYPDTEEETSAQGQKEVEKGYKPQIYPIGKNIKNYDVIAVGTPTWWYTMASPVLTFLSENDFTGKTFIPFMTNAGWPGKVIKNMNSRAKGANSRFRMEVKFSSDPGKRGDMLTDKASLDKWIKQVKDYLEE